MEFHPVWYKISNTFLFLSQMKYRLVGIIKMLVGIANRESPSQTASLKTFIVVLVDSKDYPVPTAC